MCGILAVIPLNKTDSKHDDKMIRQTSMWLHNEVLLRTIPRGRDATGIAITFDAKEKGKSTFFVTLKQPVDAKDFLNNDGEGYKYKEQDKLANTKFIMNATAKLRRRFLHIVGHTRKGTTGSEYNPMNNHPIKVGNIVAVHNGGVENHDHIFNIHPEMKRLGQVDSEALVQLLALTANDRELAKKDVQFVTERIMSPKTAYSVIAFNTKYPEKVLLMRNRERPMELAFIKELGILVITSTRSFLIDSLEIYKRFQLVHPHYPELTTDWETLPAETGSIIDVNTEVNDKTKLKDFFQTFSTASKLLENYAIPVPEKKEEAKENKLSKTDHTSSNKSLGTDNSNRNVTINKNPSTTNKCPNTGSNKETAKTATINDHTKYNKIDTSGKDGPSSESLSALLVVDNVSARALFDNSEDSGLEDLSTINVEDRVNLIKEGENNFFALLGGDDSETDDYLFRREKGNLKQFGPMGFKDEGIAETIIQSVYSEIYGEGYADGHTVATDSLENQLDDLAAVSSDIKTKRDELSTICSKQEKENVNLHEQLLNTKGKLRMAGSYIANMKQFLQGVLIQQDLISIENGKVVLDESVEAFFKLCPAFREVRTQLVMGMFKDKNDKSRISMGATELLKAATN